MRCGGIFSAAIIQFLPNIVKPYTVSFKNGTGTSGGTELTHGTKTAFEYTSSTYDADGALFAPDCNSGEKNANVRIQISKETLYAAYYGAYSGTLQLFVEPD